MHAAVHGSILSRFSLVYSYMIIIIRHMKLLYKFYMNNLYIYSYKISLYIYSHAVKLCIPVASESCRISMSVYITVKTM